MTLNSYFNHPVHGTDSERALIEDIIEEVIQIHGRQVYYIPRQLNREDKILGEDTMSIFTTAFPVEMYVESRMAHEGSGDVLSKFGLEIHDQFQFAMSMKRFNVEKNIHAPFLSRPREGDLLYFDLSHSNDPQPELYEIVFCEHEKPHYQLSNLVTYQLKCEKFKFSNEVFHTGIMDVDVYQWTVGSNASIYTINLEDNEGKILLESGTGGIAIDTPWHNDIQPERQFGNNDQFQQEAMDIVDFNIENPFGESF